MQIIVDIPDKYITSDTCFKEWIKNAGDEFEMFVLPKKHGRLIDADVLSEDLTRFYENKVTARNLINEQWTIIEATKDVTNND